MAANVPKYKHCHILLCRPYLGGTGLWRDHEAESDGLYCYRDAPDGYRISLYIQTQKLLPLRVLGRKGQRALRVIRRDGSAIFK